VALTGGRGEVVEPLDLLSGQLDGVCADVLLDPGDPLGAGNRGDVLALREQPGQRDLRRRGVDLGSDRLDLVDDAPPPGATRTTATGELATQSEAFRTRWATHNVRFHNTGVKHFNHPAVGDLHLTYNRLDLAADPGLTLFTYTAEPGSRSEEALTLLGSWAATVGPAELARATDPS
jgi:hypothetical protein